MAAVALWLLTVGVFMLPMLPAIHEWRTKRDVTPLGILRAHDRSVFAFANTYRALVEEAIDDATSAQTGATAISTGGTGKRDRSVSLEFIRGALELTEDEQRQRCTSRAWTALVPLRLPEGFAFKREVYGSETVIGGANSIFRAVMSEVDLWLGPGTVVLRWAHGRTVTVSNGARLAGQVSADAWLSIGSDCFFGRLHAPVIEIGDPGVPPETTGRAKHVPVAVETLGCGVIYDTGAARAVVDGDVEIPDDGVFHGDVVAYGNVRLGARSHIVGSIKSRADVVVGPGVVIEGAVISTRHLTVGNGSQLFGPLVAEGRLRIEGCCRIGRRNHLTSVTAPQIALRSGTIVFGTLWARVEGVVSDDGWGMS